MRNQTVQQLNRIFNARSLAVVGASSDTSKLGYMTLHSAVIGGYKGHIYPVNPKGGEILGLQVYRSLQELPADLDLAVIIVLANGMNMIRVDSYIQMMILGVVLLIAVFIDGFRTRIR